MIDLTKIGIKEILLVVIPGVLYIILLLLNVHNASIIGLIALTICLVLYVIVKVEKYSMKSRILEGIKVKIRGPKRISQTIIRRQRKSKKLALTKNRRRKK